MIYTLLIYFKVMYRLERLLQFFLSLFLQSLFVRGSLQIELHVVVSHVYQ